MTNISQELAELLKAITLVTGGATFAIYTILTEDGSKKIATVLQRILEHHPTILPYIAHISLGTETIIEFSESAPILYITFNIGYGKAPDKINSLVIGIKADTLRRLGILERLISTIKKHASEYTIIRAKTMRFIELQACAGWWKYIKIVPVYKKSGKESFIESEEKIFQFLVDLRNLVSGTELEAFILCWIDLAFRYVWGIRKEDLHY